MTEDPDKIADDPNEWGDPVQIEPVTNPDVVLSVRLPRELAESLRALARERGIKVGTLLRQLLSAGIGSSQTGLPSDPFAGLTLFFDGSARQLIDPGQVVASDSRAEFV